MGISFFRLLSSLAVIRERRDRLETLLKCLLCVLCAALAHAQAPATDGKPVHNIHLTETRDIADASAVNAAIGVLVHDAASCPEATSKDRQACACSFKGELKKLQAAYDVAVAKHPGWNEADVVVGYLDAPSGKSVTLNLPGIERQLYACAQHQQ